MDRLRPRHRPGQNSPSSTPQHLFHEADSVIGFCELNEPGLVTGPKGSSWPSRTSTSASTGPTSMPTTSPTRCLAGCRNGRRGPRPTSRSSAPAITTGRASTRCRTSCRAAALRQAPAGDRPELYSFLEQQAGARLVVGRRQVRLRPIFRLQLIADHIRSDIKGNKKMRTAQLVRRWRNRRPRTCAARRSGRCCSRRSARRSRSR